MNLFTLLTHLADADPEAYQQLSARRGVLRGLGQLGRRAAATAVPLGLGAVLEKAYGRNQTILDSFTLALQLEYLENEFYTKALASTLAFPAGTRAVVQQMQSHEQAHVAFLTRVLQSSSVAVPAKPTFDFTGSKGGTKAPAFADVFTNFATFLKVAQLLEDTGVRAYKGQVEFLVPNNDLLEAALQIHAVEARHAAHIRGMRRAQGANVRNWISKNDDVITVAGLTDAVYAGEDVTTQTLPDARVFPTDTSPVVTDTPAKTKISLGEAFDEPITASVAAQIVNLFLA